MIQEKGSPAGMAGYGNGLLSPKKRIEDNGHSSLLSFSNRHFLTALRIVEGNKRGLTLSQIQDKTGASRGDKSNMNRRREISRCCEVLVFYRYLEKHGRKFYPTGKRLMVDDEPREFGADGLPRVKLASVATMPLYGHWEGA